MSQLPRSKVSQPIWAISAFNCSWAMKIGNCKLMNRRFLGSREARPGIHGSSRTHLQKTNPKENFPVLLPVHLLMYPGHCFEKVWQGSGWECSCKESGPCKRGWTINRMDSTNLTWSTTKACQIGRVINNSSHWDLLQRKTVKMVMLAPGKI